MAETRQASKPAKRHRSADAFKAEALHLIQESRSTHGGARQLSMRETLRYR